MKQAFITIALVFLTLLASTPAKAQSSPSPLLLTNGDTNRALALDAFDLTAEPFPLRSRSALSPDKRTRLMLFAFNLDARAPLTIEALDAKGQIYQLPVEQVRPVPDHGWLVQVVIKLPDNLPEIGDILLRLNQGAFSSNNVRVGIGKVGGGAPDPTPSPTPASTPTPTPGPTITPTPTPTPSPVTDRQFYVATYGSAAGNGSAEEPLDLVTALSSKKSPVRPGDTIWLRGGVYRGSFTSTLFGAAELPITVRAAIGERATIDGEARSSPTLTLRGAYTNYRDFEVTKSDPKRVSQQTGSNPGDVSRGHSNGIDVLGHHLKMINLVIHDDGVGIGFWTSAIDSEVYGCLIYNNGWDAPDRGHGHAIYAQNNTGTKSIKDNIMFNQFGLGLQVYGSSNAYLNNFLIEGNVSFGNGALSKTTGYSENILLGGGSIARNNRLLSNYTYFPPSSRKGSNKLGYQKGCNKATVENNYFIGYAPLVLKNCTETTINNNMLYGEAGSLQTSFPNNNFYGPTVAPSLNEVFVRPNQYEPGRANIIVYNWQLLDVVYVDVSGVLEAGREYEVRNVQDFYGEPVLSGIYPGNLLRLPMKGLKVAPATGMGTAIQPTGPQFNVFVLIQR